MKKSLIFGIGMMLLFLPAVSAVSWKNYKGDVFSMDYPSDWEVMSLGGAVMFLSDGEDTVMVIPISDKSITYSSISRGYAFDDAEIRTLLGTGAEVASLGDAKIDGRPAWDVQIKVKEDDAGARTLWVFIDEPGSKYNVFQFQFVSNYSGYDKANREIFEPMVKSIKIS